MLIVFTLSFSKKWEISLLYWSCLETTCFSIPGRPFYNSAPNFIMIYSIPRSNKVTFLKQILDSVLFVNFCLVMQKCLLAKYCKAIFRSNGKREIKNKRKLVFKTSKRLYFENKVLVKMFYRAQRFNISSHSS